MKNIENFINEANHKTDGWTYSTAYSEYDEELQDLDDPKVKWLLINTEGKHIMPVSSDDLHSWSYDYEDDTVEKECKKLKVGESYDADGGINIYIRIKK